jgi:hypothetical protein
MFALPAKQITVWNIKRKIKVNISMPMPEAH